MFSSYLNANKQFSFLTLLPAHAFNLGLDGHPGYPLNRCRCERRDFYRVLLDHPAVTDKRRLLLIFIMSFAINCLGDDILKSNITDIIIAIFNFILSTGECIGIFGSCIHLNSLYHFSFLLRFYVLLSFILLCRYCFVVYYAA